MADIEIGMGKSARRAYGLDEVAIVPSRRTREPERVDLSWEIDAFRFGAPVLAAAERRHLVAGHGRRRSAEAGGGADPAPRGALDPPRRPRPTCSAALADVDADDDVEVVVAPARRLRRAEVRPELVEARIAEIKADGVDLRRRRLAGPGRGAHEAPAQGRARPARHPRAARLGRARRASPSEEPLNLKTFIRRFELPVLVGGCASYQAALHLMRTGAAGVIVRATPRSPASSASAGRSPPPSPTPVPPACATSTRPASTATCSPRAGSAPAATSPRPSPAAPTPCVLDEVLAGASDAPGGGWWWDHGIAHPTLPVGGLWRERATTTRRPLAQLLLGPGLPEPARRAAQGDGAHGYESVKELQKAELVVTVGVSHRRARGRVRHRPRRRLRRPVRAAHRPARARGPRLQRDRPAHDHRRRARGEAARRA